MRFFGMAALAFAVVLPSIATAGPWKDESGNSRWRGG
jgi:hypothetical protein